MPSVVNHLWLIPALPLAAAALGALTPRRGLQIAAGAAILAMLGAFVLSSLALAAVLGAPGVAHYANFDWFAVGEGAVRLGWLIDPLGAFMCVMVTLVGTLIFIFSLGYMRDDANAARFFCFLSLFAAGMLGLLVANSLLLLFICWELVGVASYLLIGFWFERPAAAAAAKKAFITTRIGDLGLFLGMLWLYRASGSLLFYDGGAGCLEPAALRGLAGAATIGGLAVSTAIGLLIFCGAAGKSGQFPLHVWLPDAMEGPSPVSALIHAATMVAAGVFLIARVYPLMTADQALAAVPFHALTVVAGIGAITALLGALIATAQTDIKRVLAFSTVSQLGYMMLALGVGSWVAAIFHLLTHAFFKALLFLGAGSVIHAAHHEQDIRRLGGLGPRMRITFATFAIGMMALAGVPFLFSGFWSKEAILHAAHAWPVSSLPLIAGLVAAALTAYYMTRLMAEVFSGSARSDGAAHAHESPAVMTIPLGLLAIGAVGLGFIGTSAWPWLESKLSGQAIPSESIWTGGGLTALAIILVVVGLGVGWALYGRRPRANAVDLDPVAAAVPGVFGFLAARMYFDELYAATAGRLLNFLGALAAGLDRWVWGGGVRLLGRLGELTGRLDRRADEAGLNAGFDATSAGLRDTGRAYSRAQTGQTQGYLRVLAIAFAALAILALWEEADDPDALAEPDSLCSVGGRLLLALLPRLPDRAARGLALAFSLTTLIGGLAAAWSFDRRTVGYQWVENHAWIPALGVRYHLGLDGMSLLLVLLTGLVAPAGLLASWRSARDPRLFGALFLLLQGCMLGVFLALNFFPWFLFWELSLVPAFFLIKLWGGPGASAAAYQFVVVTLAGSAGMLLGFSAIFAATGTLDFASLTQLAASGALGAKLAALGSFWPKVVFLGVFVGLAVKVPIFPFHTWLPPAYAEAPTGVSMLLTGVMSKMGVYGCFRLLWPLFPRQLHAAAGPLLWLALGGIVLGALAAMRQSDLKRMIAYSSINHVSYCLLALFAVAGGATGGTNVAATTAALAGALLQMFNHGISAAALFFCIGVLEARSGGRRGLDDFGGVRLSAPVFAGLGGLAMFSSLGLPGLNGFVGEFLIFRGTFALAPWAAAVGCIGLLVTALFLLTFWQRVLHGPPAGAAANGVSDLSARERIVLIPLVALMLLFGLLPQLLTGLFNPLIAAWAHRLSS